MTTLFVKYLLILTFLSGIWESFNKTSLTNEIKSSAASAYKKGDYKNASILYDSLISFYKIDDEKIRMNLANSYFKMENKKRAFEQYKLLTSSSNIEIVSSAYQQLGLLSIKKGKSDEAISYFKKALKTNPLNNKARYNLELILKLKNQEPERKQHQTQKKTGQEKGGEKRNESGTKKQESISNKISDQGLDASSKGSKTKNGELSEESTEGSESQIESDEESTNHNQELKKDNNGNKDAETIKTKRLAEINISEEKAKMILDEMKNEEVQYLQQQKKHLYNRDYKGKPDW